MTTTSTPSWGTREPPTVPTVQLNLINGFEVSVAGKVIDLPIVAQRLVAFLALNARPLQRGYIAASLWLDKTGERATANLRSALWRMREVEPLLIRCTRTHLQLQNAVAVDVSTAEQTTRRLFAGNSNGLDLDVSMLSGELLPDWYDHWVVMERERLRQLFLNALEQLSAVLLSRGRIALATDAAYTAVLTEPLRESAHRALIEAHFAAGNVCEASRQYAQLRRMLADEIGIEPSAALRRRMFEVLQHG
jgi:DNA-binding SARP family transcriptional activator